MSWFCLLFFEALQSTGQGEIGTGSWLESHSTRYPSSGTEHFFAIKEKHKQSLGNFNKSCAFFLWFLGAHCTHITYTPRGYYCVAKAVLFSTRRKCQKFCWTKKQRQVDHSKFADEKYDHKKMKLKYVDIKGLPFKKVYPLDVLKRFYPNRK